MGWHWVFPLRGCVYPVFSGSKVAYKCRQAHTQNVCRLKNTLFFIFLSSQFLITGLILLRAQEHVTGAAFTHPRTLCINRILTR